MSARLFALVLASATSCHLLAAELQTPDGGHYRGSLENGRLHGDGTLQWDSGAHYEGAFENGVMSGQGRLTGADGSVHSGMFRDGALNGEGRIEAADGSVLSGWFRHGVLHGQGHYRGPDGEYVGSFREGRRSGRGEWRGIDGSRYHGSFRHGLLHGSGRFETQLGDVYEGDFVDDQFTGKGQLSHSDGTRYVGEFENWLPHGAGRFTDPSGMSFEGRFERGELVGSARIRFADGSEYQGDTENWVASGKGSMKLANGDHYVGEFSDGRFHGQGVLQLAVPQAGRNRLSGSWQHGELRDPAAERERLGRYESQLYSEERRLAGALEGLAPGDPNRVDMYLLTFAGDGTQEVFRRETEFVRQQFDHLFATRGRSLSLTNSRQTIGEQPIASVTSLERALKAIAGRMDRDQDILFLYLTSHGSAEHQLSLTQPHHDLPDLAADRLAELLRSSGIRWRVVVVSACYSGGFIPALADSGTLVITAARHDRRSFGCADENDFTYFGRAFFHDALPDSPSFEEAFRKAERLIRERELALLGAHRELSERDFSLPQIAAPRAIRRQLAKWRAGLTGVRTTASAASR